MTPVTVTLEALNKIKSQRDAALDRVKELEERLAKMESEPSKPRRGRPSSVVEPEQTEAL